MNRFTYWLLGLMAAVVLGGASMVLASGGRIAMLEARAQIQDERLGRIEGKIDRLLERR